MAKTNLTAQQRAALFGASTRQHFQMLGSQTVTGNAQSISFRIPKARLLQGVRLLVEGKIKVKHASGTAYPTDDMTAYKCIRALTLDLNNGFSPVRLSGPEMVLVNSLYPNPGILKPSTGNDTLCKIPANLTASSSGASNNFEFMLDVPVTTNYRDPTGLLLAQNMETAIDLNIDIDNASAMVNNATGYTCEFESLKITPQITTFSVPSHPDAFPSLDVLKILDARSDAITTGQNYIKLATGMIYRKMILVFQKADGTPMSDADITSNIELVMNTADIPYSISPKMLRYVNKMMGGNDLPEGVYFWSFDFQGMMGYGGARDLIDTERLTELAVRFTSGCAGKLTVVSEKLSRLITQ